MPVDVDSRPEYRHRRWYLTATVGVHLP